MSNSAIRCLLSSCQLSFSRRRKPVRSLTFIVIQTHRTRLCRGLETDFRSSSPAPRGGQMKCWRNLGQKHRQNKCVGLVCYKLLFDSQFGSNLVSIATARGLGLVKLGWLQKRVGVGGSPSLCAVRNFWLKLSACLGFTLSKEGAYRFVRLEASGQLCLGSGAAPREAQAAVREPLHRSLLSGLKSDTAGRLKDNRFTVFGRASEASEVKRAGLFEREVLHGWIKLEEQARQPSGVG
jgi:hypothetical protein